MAELSRTETLLKRIRTSAVMREHVAMEATTGWPVPRRVRWEGRDAVALTAPLFATTPRSGGGIDLYPAFASITALYPSGIVAAFHDHRLNTPDGHPIDFETSVGTFPHPGAAGTIGEYRDRRSAALALYDELLDAFKQRRTLDDAWWTQFSTVLGPLLEPGLVPSYRALDSGFFDKVLTTSPGAASRT